MAGALGPGDVLPGERVGEARRGRDAAHLERQILQARRREPVGEALGAVGGVLVGLARQPGALVDHGEHVGSVGARGGVGGGQGGEGLHERKAIGGREAHPAQHHAQVEIGGDEAAHPRHRERHELPVLLDGHGVLGHQVPGGVFEVVGVHPVRIGPGLALGVGGRVVVVRAALGAAVGGVDVGVGAVGRVAAIDREVEVAVVALDDELHELLPGGRVLGQQRGGAVVAGVRGRQHDLGLDARLEQARDQIVQRVEPGVVEVALDVAPGEGRVVPAERQAQARDAGLLQERDHAPRHLAALGVAQRREARAERVGRGEGRRERGQGEQRQGQREQREPTGHGTISAGWTR